MVALLRDSSPSQPYLGSLSLPWLKAPFVPEGTPVVNALFRQKSNIENMLRACAGLRPINNMRLDTVHHPAQEAVTKTPPVAATAGKEIDAPETETAAAATAAA